MVCPQREIHPRPHRKIHPQRFKPEPEEIPVVSKAGVRTRRNPRVFPACVPAETRGYFLYVSRKDYRHPRTQPPAIWYFCNARNSNAARNSKSTRARKGKSTRNVSNPNQKKSRNPWVFPVCIWYFCNARNSNGARNGKSTRARKGKSTRNVSNPSQKKSRYVLVSEAGLRAYPQKPAGVSCMYPEKILVTRAPNHPLSGIFGTPAIPMVPAKENPPATFHPNQKKSR
eukprot:scaffold70400_cov54-Attheya_sp.AAC.4